jgi:hypothetical protein
MQSIIQAVAKDILKKELSQDKFLRYTNNGNNQIYLVNHHNAPNVVQEIGRLREITFRAAGGGTGHALDLDYNDTCDKCYEQLIVWNAEDEEIVSGYRLIDCKLVLSDEMGIPELSTAHLFSFSKNFIENYLPYTLEYKEGYKILNSNVRGFGENIPPLINTYMNLSPTMKNFGTALNNEFGAVEETGILITIADIYESKKQRHMDTFERDKGDR